MHMYTRTNQTNFLKKVKFCRVHLEAKKWATQRVVAHAPTRVRVSFLAARFERGVLLREEGVLFLAL
jgi:hypothetical protein